MSKSQKWTFVFKEDSIEIAAILVSAFALYMSWKTGEIYGVFAAIIFMSLAGYFYTKKNKDK